jgi:glutamate:GABA antiporter
MNGRTRAATYRCGRGACTPASSRAGARAPTLSLLCMVGGLASVIAFLIGFVSPSQLGHTSPLVYAVLIAAGILALGLLPPLLLYRFRKPAWKATAVENGAQP